MKLEYGKTTEWFKIGAGVRQECVLSPVLSGIAIDWEMSTAQPNLQRKMLHYAECSWQKA